MRARLALALLLLGCPSPSEPDAGTDAPIDTGADVPADAPLDAPLAPCGTGSAEALGSCVDEARYRADLETVAMERVPESLHWQLVQDLCADRLTSLGFTVERHAYATGLNVVGVRTGTTSPAERVLIAAHYDHIPGCDGADDNATGVAGALEAARVLAMVDHARTLVVACWDEEERGLIGSRAYASRAAARGETIVGYFNFEMIGYRDTTPGAQSVPAGIDALFPEASAELEANEMRGDFVAVIADPASMAQVAALERHADRIGLPFIPLVVPEALLGSVLIGDLRRSDHAAFWDEGLPAMMLTDTSEFRYEAYHCTVGDDVVANLDAAFATSIVRATVGAAAETLGR